MEVCIWSLRPLSVRQTSLLSSLQIPSLHPCMLPACLTHYALFDLSRPDLFSRNGLGQWEKCEASNSVPSCLRGLADKMPNPAQLWSAWFLLGGLGYFMFHLSLSITGQASCKSSGTGTKFPEVREELCETSQAPSGTLGPLCPWLLFPKKILLVSKKLENGAAVTCTLSSFSSFGIRSVNPEC